MSYFTDKNNKAIRDYDTVQVVTSDMITKGTCFYNDHYEAMLIECTNGKILTFDYGDTIKIDFIEIEVTEVDKMVDEWVEDI